MLYVFFFLSSACFLVAYTLLTFICRCRTCWFDSRLQQQPQATHKQKIPNSQELAIPVPSPACGIESMETPLSGYRGWSFSSRVRNLIFLKLVSAGCCSVRYCCFKEVSFALFFLLKPGVEMFVGTYDHFVPLFLPGRKRGLFFAFGLAFWQRNGYEH